jgi:predicted N-acetyltransferase YhbS
MEIVQATCADYPGILELQSANFVANLAAEERQRGFLSAEFTLSQLAAISGDLGILVARDGNRIIGYLCAHRPGLAPLPAVVEAMLDTCRTAAFSGRLIADTALFVYGPVCVARSHRGRGVLRRLYCTLLARLSGKFEVGVTLVSDDNPHSLEAHVAGLGMADVARFAHASRAYHLLAFAVR